MIRFTNLCTSCECEIAADDSNLCDECFDEFVHVLMIRRIKWLPAEYREMLDAKVIRFTNLS